MHRMIAAIFALVLLGLPAVHAVQPDEVMSDPAKEARARELSRELRCMVCQNQSIDDSEAPLARDLRLLVRERISAGDSNSQVIDFLVARYGEFVLLKPLRTPDPAAMAAHAGRVGARRYRVVVSDPPSREKRCRCTDAAVGRRRSKTRRAAG